MARRSVLNNYLTVSSWHIAFCPRATQGVYTTGLLTIMVYYAYFKLWAVFFPVSFECACIMYLTALKVYYEGLPFKATEEEKVALGAPEGAKRADASYYTSIT